MRGQREQLFAMRTRAPTSERDGMCGFSPLGRSTKAPNGHLFVRIDLKDSVQLSDL